MNDTDTALDYEEDIVPPSLHKVQESLEERPITVNFQGEMEEECQIYTGEKRSEKPLSEIPEEIMKRFSNLQLDAEQIEKNVPNFIFFQTKIDECLISEKVVTLSCDGTHCKLKKSLKNKEDSLRVLLVLNAKLGNEKSVPLAFALVTQEDYKSRLFCNKKII